jgi:hypothetical protein
VIADKVLVALGPPDEETATDVNGGGLKGWWKRGFSR